MGNTQSYIVSSVFSVYLAYVHIYCSYKLLKTNVLHSEKLPSFLFLYIKYLTRSLSRRTGHLYATVNTCECVFTALENRLHTPVLRSFCSAAGYGWDYPDTEYRDLPLCFPEFLCGRLLLMVLTHENFRLSPAGLVLVKQSLKTLEPVDELKKGSFMLQVRVLEYRHVDTGVEVDICLSATSYTGRPVWESILTLQSKNKHHKDSRCLPKSESESDKQSGKPDEPLSENEKQVDLRVPWGTCLQFAWSSLGYFPCWLLSLVTRLFGYRSQITPTLWMLSLCLAEIEKHKGVDFITAPINISAQFKETLLVPGKVTIRFWEPPKNGGQVTPPALRFHIQQHGGKILHMEGMICRS
ncbi:hypothetical protein EXN66_Car011834 [Channa argus]|uniref:Uncharacterized protein n=1 Tax=Channa argus TaxID=215402 RepID=A0A6G1Q1M6_CHAAH|nr:hypothetical protein EXN66_Car011834 [Channa argus]